MGVETAYKKNLFSLNLTAEDDDYFYAKLDLGSFTGKLTQPKIGHQADVKFVAVAG